MHTRQVKLIRKSLIFGLMQGGQHGISMIELLVAMSISVLVTLVAIPYAKDLSDSMNKRSAEIQVQRDLRYAQAMTVEEGCRGIFQISTDQKRYTFGCDYLPYDSNATPTWDTQKFTRSLPKDIKMTSNSTVIFNSRGQVIDTSENLATRTLTLWLRSTSYNVGTLRPTGLFEYSS